MTPRPNPYWSPIVHDLHPYIPGEQPRGSDLVKLNTNESPYGPSPNVLAAIQAELTDSLRLYPDPDCAMPWPGIMASSPTRCSSATAPTRSSRTPSPPCSSTTSPCSHPTSPTASTPPTADVLPSQANFVFARHPAHPGATLAAKLRAGSVLVRHFDKPRIAEHLRITVGTPRDTDRLLEALA